MVDQSVPSQAALLGALADLSKTINEVDFNVMQSLLESPDYLKETSGVVQAAFVHILNMYINSGGFDYSSAATSSDFSDLNSHLPFPVGFRSPDGSATLGKEGFVFLIGGSNNILLQYAPSCTDAGTLAGKWIEIVNTRYASVTKLGAKYLHVLIPEKISILPELMDREIDAPTKLLTAIEAGILQSAAAPCLIPALAMFQGLDVRKECCAKLDSHLSARGSFELFRSIASEHFDFKAPDYEFRFGRKKLGDLSHRMTGYFCPETCYEIDKDDLPEFAFTAKLISEVKPADGLKGTSQVWKNESAPINAKIVVFGNSYFSFEHNGQSALSWWFARYFTEFHFIWTNEVELDYVEQHRPDFVLWQGVERFAPLLPAS